MDLTRQRTLRAGAPYNTTMLEYVSSTSAFDVRMSRNAMGAVAQIIVGLNSVKCFHVYEDMLGACTAIASVPARIDAWSALEQRPRVFVPGRTEYLCCRALLVQHPVDHKLLDMACM